MRGATRTPARADRWPVVVGLVLLWLAVLADQVWVFGVLFIGWAVLDIRSGESHFVRRVTRRRQPLLFWAVIASWIAMSLLWILYA